LSRRIEGSRPLRVVQYEPSGLGGFCHYTYQLAEALARRGCDVTLVTTGSYELSHLPRHFRLLLLFLRSRTKRLLTLLRPRLGRSEAERDTETVAAANPGRRSLLRLLRLRLLHLRLVFTLLGQRTHVVHFQSMRHHQDLFLVRLLRILRIRVVYTAHDLLPHGSDSAHVKDAHAKVYRLVDRVIVHAESNRRELLELFALDPARITVIPHGSYDLLLPNGRIPKSRAREELGLPLQAKVILFFGLIKRYKGLEYLLQAFQRIEQIFPDAFLVIVGNVFRADAEGYAFYSRLVEEAARRENVLCVPRYVPIGDVGSYLSAADVIALPYTKTYQSGVLLSAYAAGRPVVVTDTGGLREIVGTGRTGLVVPPRDADSLARAIECLLERPELAKEMGDNAARLADTIYSWDEIAKSTAELYEALISEGREWPSRRHPTNDTRLPRLQFGGHRRRPNL
jgi:glycosyltransferase involved in cell wall biosynthesis